MATKLKKIPAQEAERKALSMRPGVSEFGRSTVFVTCPFCGRRTEAYVWSLAGSGKRCPNPECRAHLCYGVAIRDMVPAEEAKEKSRGAEALASPSR